MNYEVVTLKTNLHNIVQDKIKDCTIGCGLCSCKFSRSTSLYRHLRNHALKKDLMPYICSFCQVGFLDKYSLYLHASIDHHAASVTINEPDEVISQCIKILLYKFIIYSLLFCGNSINIITKVLKLLELPVVLYSLDSLHTKLEI